jgi:hypothetical protein
MTILYYQNLPTLFVFLALVIIRVGMMMILILASILVINFVTPRVASLIILKILVCTSNTITESYYPTQQEHHTSEWREWGMGENGEGRRGEAVMRSLRCRLHI